LGQWIVLHKLKVQISKILTHASNLLNFQPNLLWIILCQTSIIKNGSFMYIVNYLLFMSGEEETLLLNSDVINISIQCIDGVGLVYIEPVKCWIWI